MSTLRQTVASSAPSPDRGASYLMILNAVEHQRGLVHGQLHAHGEHCAIGSYFDTNKGTSLESALIDEVAAVNDSMPHVSERQRKIRVARWLRWKLASLGMPGYAKAASTKRMP